MVSETFTQITSLVAERIEPETQFTRIMAVDFARHSTTKSEIRFRGERPGFPPADATTRIMMTVGQPQWDDLKIGAIVVCSFVSITVFVFIVGCYQKYGSVPL